MTTAVDELLLTGGNVEISAAAGKTPTITVLAYSGGLMNVPGWGPLVIDLAGLDLSASQVSILADHDATLKGIVGHGQALVRNGKLIVTGTISAATEAAKQIIALAKTGFAFQASVGVSPTETERVAGFQKIECNGRIIKAPKSGCSLVRAGALREVSIVVLGADPGTNVSISASQKGNAMPETLLETDDAPQLTAQDIREQAAAETERIAMIRTVCGGRHPEIEAKAIREGWNEDAIKLAVLRADRPTAQPYYSSNYCPVPNHRVIEAALLLHMGCESLAEQHLGANVAQQGRDLRTTNLVDLCRASLMADGKDVPHSREAMIRAALSTYSLPLALGDAANKVLFEAYTETPATWRAFASVKSCKDFKEHTGVRPSQTGDLEEIPPGGEFKHGSISEALFKYAVDTFGKMLSIDRRDIVNDDLSLFDDTARSLGRSAMRSVSDFVYKTLLANAGAFFDAANGNYDEGAETELSATSLAVGIARMMAQRDDENRDLDIRARTLLVPPELQQTAKELLQSDFIQRASNDLPTGNALKNSVQLEVEPRLSNSERFSGTSAKAWYLFASPSDAALIVAFLQGKQSPTVEFFGLDADPNRLSATWRVFFDYGAALGDSRAAYRAKGAA